MDNPDTAQLLKEARETLAQALEAYKRRREAVELARSAGTLMAGQHAAAILIQVRCQIS